MPIPNNMALLTMAQTSLDDIEAEGIVELQSAFQGLYDLWEQLNLDSVQMGGRAGVVWSHIRSLMSDILKEETEFCEDVKQRVLSYTEKISLICEDLGTEPNPPTPGSLVKAEEALRQELDNLQQLKHKRKKAYQDLRSVEAKYSEELSMDLYPLCSGTPTQQDLDDIQERVLQLKSEWNKRNAKMRNLKSELVGIYERTGIDPGTSLKSQIFCSDNISSLSLLEEAVESARRKESELLRGIRELRDKLESERGRLGMKKYPMRQSFGKGRCFVETISALQKELAHCEKLKLNNMEQYVESLRAELEYLWDKCHVPEEERIPLSSSLTDYLLHTLENEVDRMKKYYEDVHPILEKIEERERLWIGMTSFERRASDPGRLRDNRGGRLLREERERKKLQREIPALEDALLHDIAEYEAQTGAAFLYKGCDYKTFINEQWQERNDRKENQKLARHLKHTLPMETDGTPAKQHFATPKGTSNSKYLRSATVFYTPETVKSTKAASRSCRTTPASSSKTPSVASSKKSSSSESSGKRKVTTLNSSKYHTPSLGSPKTPSVFSSKSKTPSVGSSKKSSSSESSEKKKITTTNSSKYHTPHLRSPKSPSIGSPISKALSVTSSKSKTPSIATLKSQTPSVGSSKSTTPSYGSSKSSGMKSIKAASVTKKITPKSALKATHLSRELFGSQKRLLKSVLAEQNPLREIGQDSGASSYCTTYTDFVTALDGNSSQNVHSTILSSKVGGGIVKRGSFRRKKRNSNSESVKRALKNVTKATVLTPTRGKLGLPFLI